MYKPHAEFRKRVHYSAIPVDLLVIPRRAVNIPHALVSELQRQKAVTGVEALLVHISTDQVYDGGSALSSEAVKPRPLNVYGLTKLDGERLLAAEWPRHVSLRSSIIVGPQSRVPVSRPLFAQFVVRLLDAAQRGNWLRSCIKTAEHDHDQRTNARADAALRGGVDIANDTDRQMLCRRALWQEEPPESSLKTSGAAMCSSLTLCASFRTSFRTPSRHKGSNASTWGVLQG